MSETDEILLIDELDILIDQQKTILAEYRALIPDDIEYREWQRLFFLTDSGKYITSRMKEINQQIKDNRNQQQEVRAEIMRRHIEEALNNS